MQTPTSVNTEILPEQLRVGTSWSLTVTEKVHVLLLPAASVEAYDTFCDPRGKMVLLDKDALESRATLGLPQLSADDNAPNATCAVQIPESV